jgi:hypothetical protein
MGDAEPPAEKHLQSIYTLHISLHVYSRTSIQNVKSYCYGEEGAE